MSQYVGKLRCRIAQMPLYIYKIPRGFYVKLCPALVAILDLRLFLKKTFVIDHSIHVRFAFNHNCSF